MANSVPKHSGGIKPLNAPRTVHVRTDPNGNPTSIQVPPAIESPRARRAAKRRNNPHTARTYSPPLQGRELEGGSNRVPAATTSNARALVSDGKWMRVAEIENLWKVNDEWWRGPDEEISRLYYVLRLESGQQLTIYLDLITNSWYRQSG